jgi:hypothetical protein
MNMNPAYASGNKARGWLKPLLVGVVSLCASTFAVIHCGVQIKTVGVDDSTWWQLGMSLSALIGLVAPFWAFALALARGSGMLAQAGTRSGRLLAWLVPVLVGVVCLGAYPAVYARLEPSPDRTADPWVHPLELVAAAYACFFPLVCACLALSRGHRAFRAWRRAHGHFTKAEAAAAATRQNTQRVWEATCDIRRRLLEGLPPPTIPRPWDVVPWAGERFIADVRGQYARYYGTDVAYTRHGGFFFGHPAFVLGGLALSAIETQASLNRARARAQQQWREFQPCRVLVTDQRLLCQLQNGRWLTFTYGAMTAIYPEVDDATIICQFANGVEPLMLAGDAAWPAAVMSLMQTHGLQAVAQHPNLQRLNPRPLPDPAEPDEIERPSGLVARQDAAAWD